MNKNKLVFAVEDDQSINDLYGITFGNAGFDIETFTSAEDCLERLSVAMPDIIIMDLMLPGIDGITAVRTIRADYRFNRVPIIIISAKGDEVSKVRGFEVGADDYMAKPFGVLELVARVKANIRRNQTEDVGGVFVSGEIVMNNKQHSVSVAEHEINLTLKEYGLLKVFLENENVLLTRQKLLSDIWGFDFDADTRTLDMHIMSLRSKIAEFTADKYIHTIRGAGYKFAREISEVK